MSTEPVHEDEDPGSGDRTAAPAALGLFLLAVGGWLLTTTRPWQKPGDPLTLGLGWTASAVLLLCGLVLVARSVRAAHRLPDPARGTSYPAGGSPSGEDPAGPGGPTPPPV
ncbi:hypothetical protein [Streptomyces sp. NPDC051567]|uniref:hypothetical protein n=1 Tax=Streptomyces sp. NPDC051567 TaxID=3365660 RepID=UPI0037A859C5